MAWKNFLWWWNCSMPTVIKDATHSISKQRMLVPSNPHTASSLPPGNSECKQEKVLDSAFSGSLVPSGAPEETQGERAQGAGPGKAKQRPEECDCSELRLLHFPKHRKVLNSLTWDIYILQLTVITGFWGHKHLHILAPLPLHEINLSAYLLRCYGPK